MRRRILLAVLLGCLAFVPPAGAEDWKRWYADGIKASDKKDWRRVLEAMTKAVTENPDEAASTNVQIYGMRFEPYFPHFHLGLAHYHLGDCGAALRAFAESERRRAIVDSKFGATWRRLTAECAERVGPPVAGEPEPPRPSPPVGTASANPTPLPADVPADRSTAAPESTPNRSAPIEPARIEPPVAAEPEPDATPSPKSAGLALEAPTKAAVPARLADGIRAYFRRDYAAAIERLQPLSSPSPRQRALAQLFLAAARYARWRLGGEREPALLEQARVDVRNCRRASPDVSPAAELFSPDFRAFFRSAG